MTRWRHSVRVLSAAIVLSGFPLLFAAGSQGPLGPSNDLSLQLVADGLSLPIDLVSARDGTGRMFVIEKAGTVRAVDDGIVDVAPFLDLSMDVSGGAEQGLLGLAFHPQFAENGRLFAFYTDLGGDIQVSEFHVDPAGTKVDPASERRLLSIDKMHDLHNGGQLAFGPDGYLYIGIGDGGWPNDQLQTGQDTSRLFGTILRIDVDSDVEPYAIPPDNPFAATAGRRPEIWDYGFKNPWRFSFDSGTGSLYIADVGYLTYEEIDIHPAAVAGGLNFGWRITEGDQCFEPGCDMTGLTPPRLEYGGRALHTGNCAIIGGPVSRGPSTALPGELFYGDFCSGRIWTLLVDVDGAVPVLRLDTDLTITSFGTNETGSVYVVDLSGRVFRITPRDG